MHCIGAQMIKVEFDNREDVLEDLENLSLSITAIENEGELRSALTHYINAVLTPSDVGKLTDEEFYSRLRLQLRPAGALHNQLNKTKCVNVDFSLGLDCYLVIESNYVVRPVTLEEAAQHDDINTLWNIGLRNLREVLDNIDMHLEGVTLPGSEGAQMWIANSISSVFVPSALIFGEEYLEKWFPKMDRSAGLLLGMPHRHLLIAREITTGQDLLCAIQNLSRIIFMQYESMPGPISPQLHLCHDCALNPFTSMDYMESGELALQVWPNEYLTERMEQGA